MIIRKYSCNRFAGIKDKSIDFYDGINVLLGENESGKSTLIEGIHSVLFKSTKYDKRSSEDKKFYSKFMPVPNGDVIDGALVIANHQGDFALFKEWGDTPSVQLITPNQDKIVSEEKVNHILKNVLLFGEGTFSSILFSKQIHIREALEKIIGSQETTNEVSTLLRKAIMELDGVSMDELGKQIDAEIDRLLKKWDVAKAYPENNKGINNPYKTGIGEVVADFYKKESIRLAMDEASKKEIHFDQLCAQIKNLQAQLMEDKNKIESMEKLEGDVISRAMLEPKLSQYEKQQADLIKINQEWPKHDLRLKQLQEEIGNLALDYEELVKEKTRAAQVKEKEALIKKLARIDELNKQIQEKQAEADAMVSVSREDLQVLEANQRGMLTSEAKMKAGVMIGKFTHYEEETELVITKDFDEPVSLQTGVTFKADGYIKVESANHFGFEIKSGDIDFSELRIQYAQHKENLEARLRALHVTSIEEAKLNKEKLDDIKKDIDIGHNQIADLLGEEDYDALLQRVAAYGDLSNVRSSETIDAVMKSMNDKKVDYISSQKTLTGIVNEWCKEYGNNEELLNKILDIRMAHKSGCEQLAKLAPLPLEYENTDIFRSELADLRNAYRIRQESLSLLKEDYYESEKNLPESTFEELAAEYKLIVDKFNKGLMKGKKLLKIKEAFQSTRAHMDENSFVPVTEAFSKYVVMLTNGNFQAGEIDNSFKLKLKKDPQTDIAIDLLSTGTYDSVALALRLSILEYILGDSKGFMILDDCLVDLDPRRKEMAVQLIKKFAEQHQVIFTTCNPETADLLGGNIIQM